MKVVCTVVAMDTGPSCCHGNLQGVIIYSAECPSLPKHTSKGSEFLSGNVGSGFIV